VKTAAQHKLRILPGLGIVAASTIGAVLLIAPAQAADSDTQPVLHASAGSLAPIEPGGTGTLHYEVRNAGSQATQGLLLKVALPKYVSLDEDPHCQKTGVSDTGGDLISCEFSEAASKLAPGAKITSDTPVHVAQNAPGPRSLGKLEAVVLPSGSTDNRHKANALNTVRVDVKTEPNRYDLSVTASEASGKVGDIVTVKGTATNSGPSDVLGGDVTVTAPSGTELASTPDGCKLADQNRKLNCHTDATLEAGETNTADLKFKIVDETVGADGSVTAFSKTPGETDRANNSVPIQITAVGSGGSAVAAKAASAEVSTHGAEIHGAEIHEPSASPKMASASDRDDKSSSLPVTGSKAALLGGVGVATLLAGGVLFVAARKRTRRTQQIS